MPTPYPKEFRRDVVAVARQGDQSRAQVAKAFGVSESCLSRWLRIADCEDGNDPVSTSTPSTVDEVEVRELRRRNKQLEQEVEILRRATAYFARDILPLRSSGRQTVRSSDPKNERGGRSPARSMRSCV